MQSLRHMLSSEPRVALSLGSGLADVADCLQLAPVASFSEIGVPAPSVPGHIGVVSTGEVFGVPLMAFIGRTHLYEGHTLAEVCQWVRAALECDVEYIFLTNAAGGLNPTYAVGDLMLVRDHISIPNLAGYGTPDAISGTYPWPRFIALDNLYDNELAAATKRAAQQSGLDLREGVYAMVWGPTYETPAERRLLRSLGADAVGMSTVHEAIAARAGGARVMALSLITNVAESLEPPTHEEVASQSKTHAPKVAKLISELLRTLSPPAA